MRRKTNLFIRIHSVVDYNFDKDLLIGLHFKRTSFKFEAINVVCEEPRLSEVMSQAEGSSLHLKRIIFVIPFTSYRFTPL